MGLPPRLVTMATKVGMSWFMLPSPYESHAPTLGRPASWAPVWKNVTPGSWLIASVCMVLMKHSSSAILAVWGISSLIHAPDCPCCLNSNVDGTTGKPAWLAVIGVRRCPCRTESGRSVPRRLASCGLYSHRSCCDGAPPWNR